jgi:hypothetical protein
MKATKGATEGQVTGLLREAWKHAEAASKDLAQARKQVHTRDLLEAFLMAATI